MPRQPYKSSFKWMNSSKQPPKRRCEAPGCRECGEYRAPKSRDSAVDDATGYYWFCLEHVREYNKKWDYFSGMSEADIHDYQRRAHTWERPTWRMGSKGTMEDELRSKVRNHFGVGEDPFVKAEREKQWRREQRANNGAAKAEIEALAVLDLEPPVEFDAIKARYKQLVKKYHPDLNGGDQEAEEKFKSISHAYTTLKNAFSAINSPADA